jgi:Skp family chaperone for outer membrane proteins
LTPLGNGDSLPAEPMKRLTKLLAAPSLLVALASVSAAGELKVATVDLDRLAKEYYRAQEVAKDLEARHNALFKELADMHLDYDRLLNETRDLEERSSDPALSAEARQEKKKRFELKLSDLRAFQLRLEEARAERQTELDRQASRAQDRILEEIMTATRGICDKQGFNLVLNANKLKPWAASVLFAKSVDDLTDKVLATLNATKPILKEPEAKSEPTKKP